MIYSNFDKIMYNMDYAFNYDFDNFCIDFGLYERLKIKDFFNNKIDIIKNIEKIDYVELRIYIKDLELIKNIELFSINDIYRLFEAIKNKDFENYETI